MTRSELDQAYDNVSQVGRNWIVSLAEQRSALSRTLMASHPGAGEYSYGPAPREILDFVPTVDRGRPTLVFIHGGYWQSSSKAPYACLASGALGRGMNFANVEYTLAPDARMDGIVDQIRRALDWLVDNLTALGGDPGKIYVAGHSAGGHLAAASLALDQVKGAIAISGIYNLHPIRLGSLNDKIGMSETEAERNSPLYNLPPQGAPVVIAYGTIERPEFCRQAVDYHYAYTAQGGRATLLPMQGCNHFSILDDLALPRGKLLSALVDLVGTD